MVDGGSEAQKSQTASPGSPSWGVAEPVVESLGLSPIPECLKEIYYLVI